MKRLWLAVLFCAVACGAGKDGWRPLFNGKNLDGWEPRGFCVWTVMPDGVLMGQRVLAHPDNPFAGTWPIDLKQYQAWMYRQAWLYTRDEFTEFDLHVEYFVPKGVNSGISIRDQSRAHTAIGESDEARPDLAKFPKTTPAHIGYEIQVADGDTKYPTGSIYRLVAAKDGLQKLGQWNTIDIESRLNLIRVRVNGELAAEGPGVAERSKTGPIGLQLHDQFTFMLFRNIRVREIKPH